MSNTLTKKNSIPFTQVSNSFLNSPKVSLKAKGLYAYMLSKPDGWTFTIRSMAKQLKEGPDSIGAGLNELKECNALEYTKHSDGTGSYVIDLNPNTENPNQDNPNMGKPKRISNKDINTNKDNYKGGLPEWLNLEAWNKWVQFRKDIKKKLTPLTIDAQIEMLSNHKEDHIAIIKKSIEKGWTGLFPLGDKGTPKTGGLNIGDKTFKDEEF